MASTMLQLLDLINGSVATINAASAEKGLPIPDLNELFHPATEAFRSDPVMAEAANTISAAALHLAAILTPPQVSLYHIVGGVSIVSLLKQLLISLHNLKHFGAAALRICIESNVTEILREGGPEVRSVNFLP